MFTTVTFDAQLVSMPSSAVTPPNDAPYPTLVGTPITGLSTRPPTTDGNAPSMPAITISTRAERNVSLAASSRCRPATPTSTSSSVLFPK
jgi:hypothetical protein